MRRAGHPLNWPRGPITPLDGLQSNLYKIRSGRAHDLRTHGIGIGVAQIVAQSRGSRMHGIGSHRQGVTESDYVLLQRPHFAFVPELRGNTDWSIGCGDCPRPQSPRVARSAFSSLPWVGQCPFKTASQHDRDRDFVTTPCSLMPLYVPRALKFPG